MGESGSQQELLGYPRNLAADSDQESTARPAHLVWLGMLPGPAANWLGVARVMLVTSPRLPSEVAVCRAPTGDSPRGIRTARWLPGTVHANVIWHGSKVCQGPC